MKASRKIHFCSGHRVMNHESKCATFHGHNYVAWIHAEAEGLDSIGRVIDFSVLKNKIGGWIDRFWDHTSIVYKEDIKTIEALYSMPMKKDPYISNFNPTAENMAQFLIDTICPALLENEGVKVTKIILYETENCYVEVTA